jgi:hypothetical protein
MAELRIFESGKNDEIQRSHVEAQRIPPTIVCLEGWSALETLTE